MDNETMTANEQEQTSDSFLEGWDETEAPAAEGEPAAETTTEDTQAQAEEGSGAQPAANEGADSKAAAETTAAGEGEEAQQQATQASEAPKQWTLRHLDEVRQVGEADMVALAQKGMDYDRIRGKYDESKPVMEMFGEFAKRSGMSIPDYVAYIRTQAKQAAGMSEAEARRTVSLEDREAAVNAREAEEASRQSAATQAAQAQVQRDARRTADIAEFQKTYPDAAQDPKSIPPEVWADVRGGMTLVSAYSKYTVAQAKAAQAAAEQKAAAAAQNQTNTARTTGSMQTAGETAKSRDPFLEGWNS